MYQKPQCSIVRGFPRVGLLRWLSSHPWPVVSWSWPCPGILELIHPTDGHLPLWAAKVEGRGIRLEYRIPPAVSRPDAWAGPARPCHESMEATGSLG